MAADALHLPFGDGVFDAVSILFGLRNIVGLDATLAELANVTPAITPSPIPGPSVEKGTPSVCTVEMRSGFEVKGLECSCWSDSFRSVPIRPNSARGEAILVNLGVWMLCGRRCGWSSSV
jgi:ubiE/COQ5 methyltransferase-like protein